METIIMNQLIFGFVLIVCAVILIMHTRSQKSINNILKMLRDRDDDEHLHRKKQDVLNKTIEKFTKH